jgi:hypothetical protein
MKRTTWRDALGTVFICLILLVFGIIGGCGIMQAMQDKPDAGVLASEEKAQCMCVHGKGCEGDCSEKDMREFLEQIFKADVSTGPTQNDWLRFVSQSIQMAGRLQQCQQMMELATSKLREQQLAIQQLRAPDVPPAPGLVAPPTRGAASP